MICNSCGKEIEAGRVYCPYCGKEIQLVPNYNVLEEELLSKIVEDPDMDRSFAEGVYKQTETNEEKQPAKPAPAPVKKSHNKFIISMLCILTVAAVGIAGLAYYFSTNSFEHKLAAATSAEESSSYTRAYTLYKEAYDMKPDSFEALYGLGRACYYIKDYDSAADYLSQALELEPASVEIYSYLLDSYKALEDADSIAALAKDAPNDKIADLIRQYVVTPPEFSLEGGEYTDTVTVYLSGDDNCQIFYTTNGKDPTLSGKLFSGPITIQEGTTVLSAVCLRNDGEYSQVASQEYVISYSGPSMPEVDPGEGTFDSPVTITVAVPAGGQAYYSWDGSDPSDGGILYKDGIPIISGDSILSVVVFDKKGNKSPVYRGTYHYYPAN